MKMKPLFVIAALLLFVNISCDSPQDVTVENIVTIHELDDPDGMNPLTSNAANSEYIQNNIFQKLLVYDPVSLELTPQLATSRPIIEAIEGKSSFTEAVLKAKGLWLGFFDVVDTYFEQSLQEVLVKTKQERVLEYSI